MNLPLHVAVIMDGNGRWAENRGEKREIGHLFGAKRVPAVARAFFDRGVRIVSLYAFSQENFRRPPIEVQGIFGCVEAFARSVETLGDDVRVIFSGEKSALPPSLAAACLAAEERTEVNKPFILNILIAYGGREEILRAARMLSGEKITEQNFRSALYADLPDPDLIIRTGGEKRLSGFMPFQSAYSELYFTDVLFPDFGDKDIEAALADYSSRQRRFGSLPPPKVP